MTTLTLAQLLGTPAFGNDFDLDGAIETCKKATGGGTAIAVGRITFLTESTGLWAIATAGSTGRQGVVPKLHPLNTDSSSTFSNVTRAGAEIYIEAAGVIKPAQRVMPTTGGKGIAATTPTQENAPWAYMGHYGQGSGLDNPPTDAANGDAIRVRHL
jgi:hypothetical protein